MLIKVGDKVRTGFCTGTVVEIIDGKAQGWEPMPYFIVNVTKPRLHWKKRKHTIRMDEIKGKA